jgi:DUF971 family protein
MMPQKLILHKISRTLELQYADKEVILPCALLRAHSPSADMRATEASVATYEKINILSIEPMGNYAVRLVFSDGHRTGVYSWQTLWQLGEQYGI